MMNAFLESLSVLQRTLFVIGVIFTVIGLIQTLMTVFGGDADSDFDVETDTDIDLDADGDTSGSMFGSIVTIRNMVSLFVGLAWGTLYFIEEGVSTGFSFTFGILIGIVLMVINILILYGFSKLKDPGQVFDYNDAIGKEGKVSIVIPKNGEGTGKISIIFQGRLQEIEALSNEESDLPRGTEVIVASVEDDKFVVFNKNNL
jgi:membrane protein implicated in regulation of membrane protease activity